MSVRERLMMLAVGSLWNVLPTENEMDQWLADVDVTIDRHAGDQEALTFLNNVRSCLVLMKAMQETGVALVASSKVLAEHAERYAQMRDAEDRKLVAMHALWMTMGDAGEN